MNTSPDVREKRTFVITSVAMLLFVSFPLIWFQWFVLERTNRADTWFSVFLSLGGTLASLCAGIVWLAVNRRYPRLLDRLVAMNTVQQKRFDAVGFQLVVPFFIVVVDGGLYTFSLTLHTLPIIRNALLIVIGLASLTFWALGTFSQPLLQRLLKDEDRAINVCVFFYAVVSAWLMLQPWEAAIVTFLSITWILLLRKVTWLPRYRSSSRQRQRGLTQEPRE